MKHATRLFHVAIMVMALIFTSGLFAQDAAKVAPKQYTVEFENDQVRILRISYGPGEKSVMHAHPAGVAVFLTDAQAKFTYPDGKSEPITANAGLAIWTPEGKHQPENTGEAFELIQVEIKNQTEGTNGAALRKTIEAQSAKWAAAYNRQDAAGVAALYTEDAIVLPPNHEMVQGRQAIEVLMNSEFQMGAHDAVLTTIEVVGMGDDTAYEIGKYTIKIKPEGQPVMTDSGKYMGLFKRQEDGTWLLYRDTWNSSMPMPGQEAVKK